MLLSLEKPALLALQRDALRAPRRGPRLAHGGRARGAPAHPGPGPALAWRRVEPVAAATAVVAAFPAAQRRTCCRGTRCGRRLLVLRDEPAALLPLHRHRRVSRYPAFNSGRAVDDRVGVEGSRVRALRARGPAWDGEPDGARKHRAERLWVVSGARDRLGFADPRKAPRDAGRNGANRHPGGTSPRRGPAEEAPHGPASRLIVPLRCCAPSRRLALAGLPAVPARLPRRTPGHPKAEDQARMPWARSDGWFVKTWLVAGPFAEPLEVDPLAARGERRRSRGRERRDEEGDGTVRGRRSTSWSDRSAWTRASGDRAGLRHAPTPTPLVKRAAAGPASCRWVATTASACG